MIAVQSGVTYSTFTPRRLPISLATSMSKPWYVPSAFSSDWGGYFGSVETTILPAFMILSSRPPAIGVAGAADGEGVAGASEAAVGATLAGTLGAADGDGVAALVHADASSVPSVLPLTSSIEM